jgi:tRNA threonylcarbamoyladenosine biosynthesis protein TsaB
LEGDAVVLELNSSRDSAMQSAGSLTSRAGSDDMMVPGYVRHKPRRNSGASRVFAPGASTLLAPMIKSVLDQTDQSMCNIDLIALSTGPGLFTGLRVGVVTAKSLAYATNAHLIGVNTLEVIAAQTAAQTVKEGDEFGSEGVDEGIESIRVVLNAQRQQLFCGHYQSDSKWNVCQVEPNQILDREIWLEQVSENDVVTGSGLKPIVDTVRDLDRSVKVAPESTWNCNAGSVGKLAWRQFQSGKRDDLWKLQPFYFRPSAAEEKRDAQASD